jgi:hypothetical protein
MTKSECCSPGRCSWREIQREAQCRPFMTPVDNPLDFIGMLELMKHDLFREK